MCLTGRELSPSGVCVVPGWCWVSPRQVCVSCPGAVGASPRQVCVSCPVGVGASPRQVCVSCSVGVGVSPRQVWVSCPGGVGCLPVRCVRRAQLVLGVSPSGVCVVPGWCWVSPCPAAPPSARPPPGHCAPVRAGSAAVLVALVGLWRVALAPLPGIHPPPALKEQVFTSGQQRWPWVQFFKRCFIRLLTLSDPFS